jgi:hypothetical protein
VYDDCDASFKDTKYLVQHIGSTDKHSDWSKPYVCPEQGCAAAFNSQLNLAHHRSQFQLAPIICDDCGTSIKVACAMKADRKSAKCKATSAKKAKAAKQATAKWRSPEPTVIPTLGEAHLILFVLLHPQGVFW